MGTGSGNNNTQLLGIPQSSNTSPDDSAVYTDVSFDHISQMLMNDNITIDDFFDDSFNGAPCRDETEKSFYEMLENNYLPLPIYSQSESNLSSLGIASTAHQNVDKCNSEATTSDGVIDYNWPYDYSEYHLPLEFSNQSYNGVTNSNIVGDGYDGFSNLFLQNSPPLRFNSGLEEANKFLPSDVNLVMDDFTPSVVKSNEVNKVRKTPHSNVLDLNYGRSVKQSIVLSDENVRSKMLDEVLLCYGGKFSEALDAIRERLHHATLANSKNKKKRGKRQSKEEEIIDLSSLLIQCAHTITTGDQSGTYSLLQQIRKHSSHLGSGSQRLAHYFANGLEARLAGNGSEIYSSYGISRRSTSDFLKGYRLYLAACPFKNISRFFSNQTILDLCENATSVHIVDFGINFGFQWPSLIQRFSARPGGPPKVRITGIDVPQPGFRPDERIQETGLRLIDYASSFNVPFEYNAIASKWEDVEIEVLDLRENEVLIVNCLYQMRWLADETLVVDPNTKSPRNVVLEKIRKMKPCIFIHGIVNGSYGAPFFMTRFREAMYHFSALFDLLETTVPREDEQRELIEREVFGREALNVIACEGMERVERPETYKQWQVRNMRAGFVQHPINRNMMKKARDKVKSFYHKDFDVDENGRWLLQGWKGRTVYALSSWKPN